MGLQFYLDDRFFRTACHIFFPFFFGIFPGSIEMGELAGLALAALGLVPLFTTCIEAFEYIQAGKACDRDFKVLNTRYEIRRVRLLQWGEGVGLLVDVPSNRDPRLNQAEIRKLVEETLDCINSLLTDGEMLRSQYEAVEVTEGGTLQIEKKRRVSFQRLSAYQASRLQLTQKSQNQQQMGSSVLKRTKWAICDGKAFRTLLQYLEDLIEDRYRMVPVNRDHVRLMVKEDVASLPDDAETLQCLEEACQSDSVKATFANGLWADEARSRVAWSDAAALRREEVESWILGVATASVCDDMGTCKMAEADSLVPNPVQLPARAREVSAWLQISDRLQVRLEAWKKVPLNSGSTVLGPSLEGLFEWRLLLKDGDANEFTRRYRLKYTDLLVQAFLSEKSAIPR